MHQAAQKAGLISDDPADEDRLILVLEPEAAALHCQQQDSGTGLSDLRPGTRFMIVDAGGGTVDVTVHELGTGGWLEEVVPADGGRFGSINLDRAFQQHLRDWLGPDAIRDFHSQAPLEWLKLMDRWELAKCAYDPTQPRDSSIDFPRELCDILAGRHPEVFRRLRDSQRGDVSCLLLSRAVMDAIFQKVVGQIVGVVQRQFAALQGTPCDYLFLVGGFADSPMLQRQIEAAVCGSVKRVLVPDAPGAAVLRGAVRFGLDPGRVRVRRSRFSYGCRICPPFEPGVDDGKKRVEVGGVSRCRDRFLQLVQAKAPLSLDAKVKPIEFVPLCADQRVLTIPFFRSSREGARYTDEESVTQVGVIRVKLSAGGRGACRRVEVRLHFGSTEITVTARDPISGKEIPARLQFTY